MDFKLRILAAALAVCLLLPVGAMAFSDVSEGDWFYEYVTNVCEKNIFSGVSEDSFEPGTPITRAMFITALGRLSGEDIATVAESSFADINASDWYAPFVEWAYKNGVANGTEADKFSPHASISREQAAAFVQRFMEYKKYSVNTAVFVQYKDDEAISSWAKPSVAVCTNAGIISGYEDSTFRPSGNITRAEAAVVMTKLEAYIVQSQKGRIFNFEDRKKLNTAIKALGNTTIKEGIYLAKDIYNVAFSKNFAVTGTENDILDKVFSDDAGEESVLLKGMVSLYGGAKIEETEQSGSKKAKLTAGDFVTGDIIAVQKNTSDKSSAVMYIYDGKEFMKLKYDAEMTTVQAVAELAVSSDRFVCLRPSYVMKDVNESLPFEEESMNDHQKAVVETAEYYLQRGYRVQYADTRLAPSGEFRWQSAVKAPEDYTADECGYTNCAAFATDVHRMAVGWESELNTTATLIAEESLRVFYYQPTGQETPAEREKIEKDFLEKIVPGDIIVIRRPENSGHAMLYTGSGNIIHSTGSNYNYETGTEVYEPSIRYMQLKDLFTPEGGERRFVFGGVVTELGIIRPKTIRKNKFPEEAVKRNENLKGIVAEKLSSHKVGMTVNPGDEMTFTFSVLNTNDYEVTLDITDSVPAGTTCVSGEENLSAKLTVPAGERKEISYTVKVNESATGEVYSDMGRVGGVPVNCPAIKIGKTLTKEEQDKLINAVGSLDSKNPIKNINAVYNKAFSTDNLFKSMEDIASGLFEDNALKEGTFKLKESGELVDAVAPSMFGGRLVYAEAYNYRKMGAYYRTRLVKEQCLVVGDVIVTYNNSGSDMYLYTGEGIVNLTSGEKVENTKKFLDSLLATQIYFAVIRPSLMM